jgi:hypothetical protein
MRYRGNSKIKYEHGMIQGLRELLESIEDWPEITSMIPARITPTRASGRGFRLEIKDQTPTGVKALAKTGASVQEVFFVTSQPAALERRLRQSFKRRK